MEKKTPNFFLRATCSGSLFGAGGRVFACLTAPGPHIDPSNRLRRCLAWMCSVDVLSNDFHACLRADVYAPERVRSLKNPRPDLLPVLWKEAGSVTGSLALPSLGGQINEPVVDLWLRRERLKEEFIEPQANNTPTIPSAQLIYTGVRVFVDVCDVTFAPGSCVRGMSRLLLRPQIHL